jgi:hypothetical protein
MLRRPRLELGALLAALLVAGCSGGGGGGATGAAASHPAPGEFGAGVVRVTGRSPTDVAAAAVLANYPPKQGQPPNGWVLVSRNDWRSAVLAAQFGATPVSGGIVSITHDFIPTATQDILLRQKPAGFPLSQGIQALLLGDAGPDIFRGLHDLNLKVAQLKAKDAPSLALQLVPYRGGFAHATSSQVLVVPADKRDYALPAAAWSAYSGDTITFVNRNSVPSATRALLVQRKKLRAEAPTIYIVGPPSVISPAVASQLGQYGQVKRIPGSTPIDMAIAFARYRDPSNGFGWGLTHGPASVSLVNTSNWGDAMGAFNFAAAGPQAPLLLTSSRDRLPPQLLSYLASLRGPAPNHGFVFGDAGRISSTALHQLDAALAARR